MSDGGNLPPADWYSDPTNPARMRYWDGAAWTAQFAPPPGERAAPEPPPPPIAPAAPPVAVTNHVPQVGGGCVNCGMHGTLTSKTNEIRSKTRVKFGVFWVVLTFLTCGLTFFVWLMMPRENRLLSVDRYNECSNCKVRQ